MYLHPYTQNSVTIGTWEENPANPRYGQPKEYKIKMTLPGRTSGGMERLVHWSRVIHIAEEPEENDVIGTPRLRVVYNRLQDLDKVAGGSAEMFWRGAFPGYALKADPEFEFKPGDMEALEEEITKFVHDLQRYFRSVGVDIKELASQVSSPEYHIDILIQLISAATSIPKRILTGSERGELASTMDERNWNTHIETRRDDHCELLIIRPFISRLVDVKALPSPGKEGYTVEWSDLSTPTEKEEAEVTKMRAEALNKYKTSGAEDTIPWSIYLKREMGFSDDEIAQMEKAMEEEALDAEVAEAEAIEYRRQLEQELMSEGWTPPALLPAPEPEEEE
jgi:hypothetical protein